MRSWSPTSAPANSTISPSRPTNISRLAAAHRCEPLCHAGVLALLSPAAAGDSGLGRQSRLPIVNSDRACDHPKSTPAGIRQAMKAFDDVWTEMARRGRLDGYDDAGVQLRFARG